MAKSTVTAKAVVANELRWFATAAALLSRKDKDAAILDRAEQIRVRIANLESAMSVLTEAGLEVEVFAGLINDYEQIMTTHDDIVEAAARIKARQAGGPAPRTSGESDGPCVIGRLPTLQLTHFGGKMEEWVAFKNLFESLVDSRHDLSKAQKMAYLLSTLEDEARSLIQHLRVEDDQYDTAWELLNSRFQNVRLLADAHAAQLLALPKVANRAQLRLHLLTPVTVACNALRTLGLPVDQWSFLLVHILLGKLPNDIRSRFERENAERDSTTLPTLSDLVKFLEFEARAAETSMTELAPSGSLDRRPSGPSWRGKPKQGQQPSPRAAGARFVNTAAVARNSACLQCGQMGHGLLQCRDWQRLPVADRRRTAKRHELCFYCLGNHYARDCQRAKSCSVCGGPHHELLCMNHSGVSSPALRQGPPTGGGAPARSHPPSDGGNGFARRTPSREGVCAPARVSAVRDTAPPMHGQYVAGQALDWAAMGGGRGRGRGPKPEVRCGTPPSVSAPATQQESSLPVHEYPRLEYHPPYNGCGRAPGTAPPHLAMCTLPPYWCPPSLHKAGRPN